jgi:hypothetical protein
MNLRSGLAAALVAACLLPLDAAAADQRAAVQADRQWMTALEKKDVPAVQALLDAEFQWTNTEGLTLDRSATIANAPALAAALRGDTGVQTYDYGHVAVITSVRQGTRLMRVWALRPEGWRAFAVIATEQATGTPPFAASGGEESGD